MPTKLIIVSNRLPISVKKVNGALTFTQSVGGLATGLASYTKDKKNRWVGWPGIANEDLTEDDRIYITKELKKHGCFPVFLTQKQIEGFYNGYSNGFLWPLFHDMKIAREVNAQEKSFWRYYQEVNRLFSEATLTLSDSSDQIWIHDYQLLLMPHYLRFERPRQNIGLFSHIPFPKADAFGALTNNKTLLRGMLQANLIGFHTESYVHNFLETVRAYTSHKINGTAVVNKHHTAQVTHFPIGIDYPSYNKRLSSLAAKKSSLALALKFRGKKVIVAVDRLDPSKGLVERVKAYRRFLRESARYHNKVVFVMVVAPSRTDIQAYKDIKTKLEREVRATNKEFGTASWTPIDYRYATHSLTDVSLLLRRADVGYIVPLKDGMNLVAKEYIASKKKSGVLILSKTAGAAEQLTDAIIVDPHDLHSVVAGLQQALSLPKRELKSRFRRMQNQVANATIQKWAHNFITGLKHETAAVKSITHSLTNDIKKEIAKKYKHASMRMLFFDYDGVLEPFHLNPTEAHPPQKLLRALRRLSETAEVVVISGRRRSELETWFGDLPIHLAAEHGMYIKTAGSKSWRKQVANNSNAWYSRASDIMQHYADQAQGSFVEHKESSLVWHFRGTSSYNAQKYLMLIRRFLRPLARKYDLSINQGMGILELRQAGINKGTALQKWLKKQPDFILAIGDDYTDEDMFSTLPSDAFSVKVGSGRTAARYRVKDVESVLKLLQKLRS